MWELRTASSDRSSAADLPTDAGTVVIGGGLTGLTTALLLAEQGEDVLLLEARHLGAGTTGRSTAKLSLLQGTQFSQVSRKHGDGVLRQYAAAHRDAQAWAVDLATAEGVSLEQRDAVTYANGAPGLRALQREESAVQRAGLSVRRGDAPELPFPVAGALWMDGQYQVDPLALVAALARRARAAGVEVVEGARVTSVRDRVRDGKPVRLEVERSGAEPTTVRAGRVVVATNMPMLDRGGFFARMSPQRSYSIAFELPGRAAADLPRAMYLAADQPSRSLREASLPGGPPVLLVGGAGHATGRSRPTSERLGDLRSWTAEHFPGAVEVTAWSAQDYAPHHSLPYAGPIVPGNHRILVAGGFSKWGMTGGIAAALALASDLRADPPEWRDALRPWSRHELTGLPSSGVINAEVAVAMALGWVAPGATSVDRASAEPQPDVARRSRFCGLRRGKGAEGSAVCTHLGGVLTWNDAERSWDCPLHGSRFDEPGDVLEGPAVRALPTP
nr:FAD-dependent oxidoreductase [Nocardioides zeae]